MKVTKKVMLLARAVIAVSSDGLVKVTGFTKPIGTKDALTLKGVNVGFGGGHGIDGMFIDDLESGMLCWTASKDTGFDASEVALTFDEEGRELPPAGEYEVTARLNYIREDGEVEEIELPGWTLKVLDLPRITTVRNESPSAEDDEIVERDPFVICGNGFKDEDVAKVTFHREGGGMGSFELTDAMIDSRTSEKIGVNATMWDGFGGAWDGSKPIYIKLTRPSVGESNEKEVVVWS